MGKKRMSGVSLAVMIIAVLAVIVVAAGLIYNFVVGYSLKREYSVVYNELTKKSADVVESRLKLQLETLEYYAEDFSDYEKLTDNQLEKKLEKYNKLNQFYDVAIFNKIGMSFSAKNHWVDLGIRDYFKTAYSGTPNISKTLLSSSYDGEMNVFAVPVYDDRDVTIIGVLIGVVTAGKFDDMLSDPVYGSENACYIVTSLGEIVVTCDGTNLPFLIGDSLFNTFRCNDEKIMETKNVFANAEASGYLEGQIAGEDYYVGYKSLNVNDWVLLTVVPSSVITGNTSDIFTISVIFAVVVVMVVLLLSVYIIFTQKRLEKEIDTRDNKFKEFAYVDPVTGFGTWNKFKMTVPDLLKDYSTNYAMLSLDINKFRAVNDLLGHEEGNLILKKLAGIIKRNLNEDEAFSRNSADTFYAIIVYKDDEEIIEKITNIINDIDYQITEFKILLSFGIFRIVDRNMPIRLMADRADLARRTIKSRNESSFAFFDNSMLSKIREEKAIENVMESALEKDEFKVYLQPKYDMNNEEIITGAEALVRWKRGDEIIPPGRFIPLFEKNRFVLRLDMYIFEEVCKQQKLWINRGLEPKVISVNMSRVHLQDPLFVQRLAEICRRYNVSTKFFEIEITESAAFENLEVLSRMFRELKAHNFHISIDDFGTGYSSLNMLKDLPVDVLKIDREFLTGSRENDRASEIIAHVISLAAALKMKTICEGIETRDQVELLRKLGCDMAQGFYFARPMPIENFEALIYGDKNE